MAGGVTVKGVLSPSPSICLSVFPAVPSTPCHVVYLTLPEDPQQWNPVPTETPETSGPKQVCVLL